MSRAILPNFTTLRTKLQIFLHGVSEGLKMAKKNTTLPNIQICFWIFRIPSTYVDSPSFDFFLKKKTVRQLSMAWSRSSWG